MLFLLGIILSLVTLFLYTRFTPNNFNFIQSENLKPKITKLKTKDVLIKDEYVEMLVEATAYANTKECCHPYFDGKTSTGCDANEWGVAVDPKVIPYFSIIEIEGIGKLIADDTGGSIKGYKIDIRFPNGDIDAAKKWGRKIIKVKVHKNDL